MIERRRRSIINRHLLIAATHEYCIVDTLLRSGADISYVDQDGNTILNYAVWSGAFELVDNLFKKLKDLNKEVNVNYENNKGMTLLRCAREHKDRCETEQTDQQRSTTKIQQDQKEGMKIIELLVHQIIKQSQIIYEKLSPNPSKEAAETKPTSDDLHMTLGIELEMLAEEATKGKGQKKSGEKPDKAIELVCLSEHTSSTLEGYKESPGTTLLIIQLDESHWATLGIFKQFVIYVDPKGEAMPEELRKDFEEAGFNSENIKEKSTKRESGKESATATLSLSYLQTMMNMEPEPTEDDLENIEFISELEDNKIEVIAEMIANTRGNIKYCNTEIQKCNANEDWKLATSIIHFIETFALEGSGNKHNKQVVGKYLEKHKIISSRDVTTMGKIRHMFFKMPERQLTVKDVEEQCLPNPSSLEAFQKYVQQVEDRLMNPPEELEAADWIDFPKSNFKSEGKEDLKREMGTKISDKDQFIEGGFEQLITVAVEGEGAVTDETLFEFLVNFYPAFEEKTKKTGGEIDELKKLRNSLVHDPLYKLPQFRKALIGMRSELFKCYYAQKINNILRTVREIDEQEIEKKLEELLTESQEQFSQKFTISAEEQANSFEFKFVRYQYLQNDKNLGELVESYLKLMIMTEDGQREKTIHMGKEERREVFERILNAKAIKNVRVIAELKTYLEEKYGVAYFDQTVKDHIENNTQIDKNMVQKIRDTVKVLSEIKYDFKMSLESVIRLYESKVNPNQDSRNFCTKHLEKNYPTMSNTDKQTIEKELNCLLKEKVEKMKLGDVEISFDVSKVVINILQIFSNAYSKYQIQFKNIVDAFQDETVLTRLVEMAFNEKKTKDKDNETERNKMKDKDNETERNKMKEAREARESQLRFISLLIRKLKKVSFATPYISKLITKAGENKVADDADLCELIRNLVMKERGLYMNHLNELLSAQKDTRLYRTLCEQLVHEKVNINNMKVIFTTPEHTKNILENLFEIDKTHYIFKQIVKLIGRIAGEFEGDKTKMKEFLCVAQQAAESYQSKSSQTKSSQTESSQSQSSQTESSQSESSQSQSSQTESSQSKLEKNPELENSLDVDILDLKLHTWEFHIFKLHDKGDWKENSFCKIVDEIKDKESPQWFKAQYLLALSKENSKDFKGSGDEFETLLKCLYKTVVECDDPQTDLHKTYKLMKTSGKYKTIVEYSKKLDILRLQSTMAYMKNLWANHEKNTSRKIELHKEALELYEKLYEAKKEAWGKSDSETLMAKCDVVYTGNALARCYRAKDKKGEAVEKYQDALLHCNIIYGILRSENKPYSLRITNRVRTYLNEALGATEFNDKTNLWKVGEFKSSKQRRKYQSKTPEPSNPSTSQL